MRVLAIHRYFWPDTPPYASILRSICAQWVRDGHEVHVLTGQPSYKPELDLARQPEFEIIDGFAVHRLRIGAEKGLRALPRILNILRFSFSLFFTILLRKKFDVVMVSTAPPVLAGLAVALASKIKGVKFIYHCMDIHPEVGRLSGEFSNKYIFSFLLFLDRISCRIAEKVIVLSDDMRLSLERRGGIKKNQIIALNNFYFAEYEDSIDTDKEGSFLLKKERMFRVLFAGNIGRFQNLEAIVKGMGLLSNKSNIELVFLGEGVEKWKLKDLAGTHPGNSVVFLDHQPYPVAKRIIQDADLCLVALAPDIEKYAFPSKTITYLGMGKPLLVLVHEECALTRMVLENQVGRCVVNGSPEQIASVIMDLVEDIELLIDMRRNAQRLGQSFEEEAVLPVWSDLLRKISHE